MGQHLVLVGGGHAHMVTLANIGSFIAKGHQVTVIGPSAFHYYSGMGPGMLGKTYKPEEIRFKTKHLVEKQGGRFVLGKAATVDARNKKIVLTSGEKIPYDVVSFNAGSYVPDTRIDGDPVDIFFVKPIERLMEAQARILELASQKEITVGIAGGGPSSAEIAGNVWRLLRNKSNRQNKIQIFAGKSFMARFPEGVRRRVIRSLKDRGIAIIEGDYVERVKTGKITLESGREVDADIIFMALGVKPSSIFASSGLPVGDDQGLLVNSYLQCVDFPEMFGGGDCICFKDQPLDKVGVYAVRQNLVLYENLMAFLEGRNLRPFNPGGEYLLIFNLGDGTGVLRKWWFISGGKFAFVLKDAIDRKFIRKFQAFE